ncbi:hypothetical protein COLO4_04844 [Corchorus olitorius]|uniref:Uncharacterized protein n=1 Tax=Corchorus olitorius TaxID=93759 RepID=A0A1R3KSQ9_9ROSI|nr:hypothetical protein COLO4_04844 [Corchorus olitorius]
MLKKLQLQNQFKPLKSNGASSGSSHGAGSSKPAAKSTVTHGTKRKSAANPIGTQESVKKQR